MFAEVAFCHVGRMTDILRPFQSVLIRLNSDVALRVRVQRRRQGLPPRTGLHVVRHQRRPVQRLPSHAQARATAVASKYSHTIESQRLRFSDLGWVGLFAAHTRIHPHNRCLSRPCHPQPQVTQRNYARIAPPILETLFSITVCFVLYTGCR